MKEAPPAEEPAANGDGETAEKEGEEAAAEVGGPELRSVQCVHWAACLLGATGCGNGMEAAACSCTSWVSQPLT